MIRVIVADDHPIVRHGLGRLIDLEPDMKLVAEAADGAELIGILGQHPCDVLVLDLSLPHLRGLELLAAIKERWPALAVLVFSVQPEDNFSLFLMDAGAAGYLSKDRMIEQVIEAIRCVAAGRPYITNRLAELRHERGSDALAPHQHLSAREHEVFTRVIQGMTVSAITAEWDCPEKVDTFLMPRTSPPHGRRSSPRRQPGSSSRLTSGDVDDYRTLRSIPRWSSLRHLA